MDVVNKSWINHFSASVSCIETTIGQGMTAYDKAESKEFYTTWPLFLDPNSHPILMVNENKNIMKGL